MQAIILAAGYGSRLKPLTDKEPKALTEVNGVPLLVNALNLLAKNHITETIIVVGYMKEKIIRKIGYEVNGMKITYVENNRFDTSNNIFSFYLAKEYIKEDVLLLEGDLYYNDELIKTIIEEEEDCNILVSKYNEKTMDGTIICCDEENNVKLLLTKKQQNQFSIYPNQFKTVNVYKFKKEFITNIFLPQIELYIKTQNMESYYELVLGAIIYFGNNTVKIVIIDESQWAEIDDINDLALAEQKFRNMIG